MKISPTSTNILVKQSLSNISSALIPPLYWISLIKGTVPLFGEYTNLLGVRCVCPLKSQWNGSKRALSFSNVTYVIGYICVTNPRFKIGHQKYFYIYRKRKEAFWHKILLFFKIYIACNKKMMNNEMNNQHRDVGLQLGECIFHCIVSLNIRLLPAAGWLSLA